MPEPAVIRIEGLEVFAHHGLLPREREIGQLFLFNILMVIDSCSARESDEITDTVDYAAVADCVVETATAHDYTLLERLADVVAETLLKRFTIVDRVSITVAKPTPPMEHSLDRVSVTVQRGRRDAGGL